MKAVEIKWSSNGNSKLLMMLPDKTSLPDNDVMSRISTAVELADFWRETEFGCVRCIQAREIILPL